MELYCQQETYRNDVIRNIKRIAQYDCLPPAHVNKLYELREEHNFQPQVIYDIGSCVLHWTKHAEKVWKDSKIILFEAFDLCRILYTNYDFHMGVLCDIDEKKVKFYQNDFSLGGNSVYKENNATIYPEDKYIEKIGISLDTVVQKRGFPYAELIKMDVQGSEMDILKGASECLRHAKFVILELQKVEYNQGAPLRDTVIQYMKALHFSNLGLFSDNGPDGDFLFQNQDL